MKELGWDSKCYNKSMVAPLVKVTARWESQRGALTLIPIVVFMAIVALLLLSYLDQSRTQREME